MKRPSAFALLLAVLLLPAGGRAAGVAHLRVTNVGTDPIQVEGRTLRRGAATIVKVPAGEPGVYMGKPYPAIKPGGIHVLRVDEADAYVPRRPESPAPKPWSAPAPVVRPAPPSRPAPSARPSPSRTPFLSRPASQARQGAVMSKILSKLDTDGVYLEVIDASAFEAECLSRIRAIGQIASFVVPSDESAGVLRATEVVANVAAQSGLLAIRGCGTSVRAGPGPGWRARSFLLRDPPAGWDPSAKAPTEYLPAGAYFAAASTFDLSGLYKLCDAALARAEPGIHAEWKSGLAELRREGGIDLEKDALSAFAPGFLIAVVPDRSVPVPADFGQRRGSLFFPGAVLGLRTADDRPLRAVRQAVLQGNREAGRTAIWEKTAGPEFPDVAVFGVDARDGIDVGGTPFCPVLAWDARGKMLLFATSRNVLADVLRASRGKGTRLEQTPVFKTSAAGLPADGDLFWISPEILQQLAQAVSESGILDGPDVPEFLRTFVDALPEFWCVERTRRTKEGVMTESNVPYAVSGSVRLLEHYFASQPGTSLVGCIWDLLPDENSVGFFQLLIRSLQEDACRYR